MTSIFTKIIERKLPATILYENEHVIVIEDINPVAPVHLLIIAKKEVPSIQVLKEEEMFLVQEIIKAAQKVAREKGLIDYRLLTNNGPQAGQSVYHLHFHLLSGRDLGSLG